MLTRPEPTRVCHRIEGKLAMMHTAYNVPSHQMSAQSSRLHPARLPQLFASSGRSIGGMTYLPAMSSASPLVLFHYLTAFNSAFWSSVLLLQHEFLYSIPCVCSFWSMLRPNQVCLRIASQWHRQDLHPSSLRRLHFLSRSEEPSQQPICQRLQ